MLIIGSILQVLKVCESNKNANEFKLYKQEYYSLYQGWPTQLHNWANISAPILKRAAKLLLMTDSHYFTLFSSNFFDDLFDNLIFSLLYLPKAYPP